MANPNMPGSHASGDKKPRRKVARAFKMNMFIDRIGIEFEGGWDRYCRAPFNETLSNVENTAAGNHRRGCQCMLNANVGDGSVRCNGMWTGEIPRGPFQPTKEKLNEEFIWYPDHGNSTCGLHLHVSFKRQYYYRRLMSIEFYAFFKKELAAWGKRYGVKNPQFYARLNGEGHYCRDEWNMEEQVNADSKVGARYAILNYCYRLHKTLEVRVLPYFKSPETAKAAIMAVLNIICDWLYQHRGKRPAGDARAACVVTTETATEIPEVEIEVTPTFRYGSEFEAVA